MFIAQLHRTKINCILKLHSLVNSQRIRFIINIFNLRSTYLNLSINVGFPKTKSISLPYILCCQNLIKLINLFQHITIIDLYLQWWNNQSYFVSNVNEVSVTTSMSWYNYILLLLFWHHKDTPRLSCKKDFLLKSNKLWFNFEFVRKFVVFILIVLQLSSSKHDKWINNSFQKYIS